MKASVRWLRELTSGLDASPKEIAARFTHAGLEVEVIHEFGLATESTVIARVEGIRPHPNKSGLRLVAIDRGGDKSEVVCGAPNVPEPGGLVVFAPLGTHLPAKGITIGKRAIGGVESEGMLCSEDELGLGGDHDGIIVLPAGSAPLGASFASVVPSARDTVLEIGLTPNRPDGLGHIGLARELAALSGLSFAWPEVSAAAKSATPLSDLIGVSVEDQERCPHFGVAAAVGVKVGPSPVAVRYRLQALGIRSISNVVDITNLVMLEFGHPMHAFDLDRVRGSRLVVRCARAGEALVTLDGQSRTLDVDDVVVCDAEGPVALAGIMGGSSTEIRNTTERVLFECAWWQPRSIRRSARRHGMHTDASHRFERGVDTGDVGRVLDRALSLTASLSGAAAAVGQLHVQGGALGSKPIAPAKASVSLRSSRIDALLGVTVPFAEATAILERLGFDVNHAGEARADVLVPTHRPDIVREVDLVEEVIRVRGFDTVAPDLPAVRASRDVGGREALLTRARGLCVSLGLSEAITYSFTSRAVLETLRAPAAAVVLKNPLGEHHAVMRTTLLAGLTDGVTNARRHGVKDIRQFTLGPVFLEAASDPSGLPHEELRVAFVLAGERYGWLAKPSAMDPWDAKGVSLSLARGLAGARATMTPAHGQEVPPHLHPRAAAFVHVGETRLGSFGLLHPDVVDELELGGEVLVGEFRIESFVNGPQIPHYTPIPRFPAATRDVALVVKDDVPAGAVEDAVREAAGPLAEDVRIFDRFSGGHVPPGSSSLAFHVVYRAEDRTLTDAEVDAAHENVVRATSARFGAVLR